MSRGKTWFKTFPILCHCVIFFTKKKKHSMFVLID
uniref:Uncharacterized protein n=1 Tax=Anguilla anguilla TaxID=7936 RepID=A0A0E9R6L5_ANGAN